MKKILQNKKIVLGSLVTALTTVPTLAFATTGGSVTSSMTTAMDTVKGDTLSAIGAVAPIGIGIMGAFLVWRYGIKFFKSISK